MIPKERETWKPPGYAMSSAVLLLMLFVSATGAIDCEVDNYHPYVTVNKNVNETVSFYCAACSTTSTRNVNFTWEHRYRPNGVVQNRMQTYYDCRSDSCSAGLYCDSELTIPSVTVFDRGQYTCRATCKPGQSDTHDFNIKVKGPPHFKKHPTSHNISHGDDIDLACTIESDPTISRPITWVMENGETLYNASETMEGLQPRNTSTIQLTDVTQKMKILCQAGNSFGTVNSTIAYINIKVVPDPVQAVVLVNKTSSSVRVSWTQGCDGYSAITAFHIKIFVSICPDNIEKGYVDIDFDDLDHLWHPITALENITLDKVPMKNFANMTLNSYNITKLDPVVESIDWYSAPMINLTNLNSNMYNITNLVPATEYAVKLAISNDQGMSNWSDAMTVKTNYIIPPAPSHVSAYCCHEKLTISWALIPDGKQYGKIKRYIVTYLDNDNNEKHIKINSGINHTQELNKHLVSTYNISVRAESEGGIGPKTKYVYYCYATLSCDEGENSENKSYHGVPKLQQSPEDDDFVTKDSLVFILCGIGILLLIPCIIVTYRQVNKRREKQIALNIPTRAYVDGEEAETTNNELSLQSDERQVDRPNHQTPNMYSTHIIKMQDQQPQFVDLPPERFANAKAELKRMTSEDYENAVAGFAQLIQLDEESKKELYQALIPFEKVTIGKVVGEGEFGEVCFGYVNQGSENEVKIAIKKMKDIKDNRSYETFIKEGIITTAFDHPNVLAIIGISLAEDANACVMPLVLMPYMENGDLRTFLYNARVIEKVTIGFDQLIGFMMDIAEGMQYLATKKFVHRDLAARNCMLDSKFTVKIGDFGLTRKVCDENYYRICKNGKSCKVPVKWVAIESLRDGRFTTCSDVWAYGVTMWEIITQSQIPYPGVSNCTIYEYLAQGNRLHQPPECPDQLYSIMYSCWDAEAENRPNFCELKESLEQLLLEWKKIGLDDSMQSDAIYVRKIVTAV